MVFEKGKYYRHSAGAEMSIVGEVETTLYGNCLVAENAGKSCKTDLSPVGRDEEF